MEAPSLGQLDSLKYPELRKLAKAAGVKANLKADRLLRALKKHFHPALVADINGSDSDGSSTLTDDSQVRPEEEEPVPLCHVTHRRGRGRRETRVDSSPETEQKVKAVQADKVGSDAEETSSVPALQNQHSSAENTVNPARRRSRRRRSSGKKSGGNIPKNAAVSTSGSKPSTPNFKRIHEAQYKKMESIDKYLERKQKRLDALSSSIQKVKMLTKSCNQQKSPGSNKKKSLQNRFSLLSPAPQTGNLFSAKTPANPQSGRKKSILVDRSGAKASTYSSSKMNVRFSGATKDNEHKCSLVKTPARKSSTFVQSIHSEPRRSLPLSSVKASKGPEDMNLSAVTTPFKFTAQNMATPKDAKIMKFDLQASLARPLGYQPHKGKLKPWGESKENQVEVQSQLSTLKNTYKQPPVPTREDRRKRQERDRKSKRDKTLGSRRGVAVP